MSASKKSRHARHSQYRVATPKRARQPEAATPAATDTAVARDEAQRMQRQRTAKPEDAVSTQPVAAVTPPDDDPIMDKPTIILSPEEIAALSSSPPPLHIPERDPSTSESGYTYLGVDAREAADAAPSMAEPDYDAPTIVLDVAALMDAPPPPIPDHPAPTYVPRTSTPPPDRAQPVPPQPAAPRPSTPPPGGSRPLDARRADPAASLARPDMSWPRPPRPPQSVPPAAPPNLLDDPQEEFARLREQRLAREHGVATPTPDEPYISEKLRQWWQDIQPGIDRVLGRSHRGGSRAARATIHQTSAQLPVVRVPAPDDAPAPAVQRLSSTAREIGTRAQTAAMPALAKFHSRAERAAQQLVDRIDEHLGGRPPMQHVLLGPGRMIVAFTTSVSIRDAQLVIASVQARSLRRLVGYNAYLVLVPPGREAIYAERFHTYREITGVHFGPQRPGNSATGKLAPRSN